jgi:hypothetical protein
MKSLLTSSPKLLAVLSLLQPSLCTVDYTGTVQTTYLYEDSGNSLTYKAEYYYETLALDDPDEYEYLNFKLIFENYDISSWNVGDGFWMGIAFDASLMAENPDSIICRIINYSGIIATTEFECEDMTLKGYAQPVVDTQEDLDTRLVEPVCT